MNVEIKVVPNAKKREVIVVESGLRVKVLASPVDGKANEDLIGSLSEFFRVKKSQIKIVRGEKERKKVVALPLDEAEYRAILEEKVKVTTG